jgi:hypothetical protein
MPPHAFDEPQCADPDRSSNQGDSAMRTTVITETINRNRRRFLGTAAMTIAAAQFASSGPAEAQSGRAKSADLPRIKPGTHTSFASLKQIDAGVLKIGRAHV